MKFSQIEDAGTHLIEAYDAAHIRINGQDYGTGLAVSAEELVVDWGPRDGAELTNEHIDALLALRPQVVILGTGTQQRFPHPAVYRVLLENGIGVEIMDTGAACRTYNILVSEGRPVAAGLLLG
ncbi:MAG: Mth938-like domain-containing protein [Thiohalocapsa sp.]